MSAGFLLGTPPTLAEEPTTFQSRFDEPLLKLPLVEGPWTC